MMQKDVVTNGGTPKARDNRSMEGEAQFATKTELIAQPTILFLDILVNLQTLRERVGNASNTGCLELSVYM